MVQVNSLSVVDVVTLSHLPGERRGEWDVPSGSVIVTHPELAVDGELLSRHHWHFGEPIPALADHLDAKDSRVSPVAHDDCWDDGDWINRAMGLLRGVSISDVSTFPGGLVPLFSCCGDPYEGYVAVRMTVTGDVTQWESLHVVHPGCREKRRWRETAWGPADISPNLIGNPWVFPGDQYDQALRKLFVAKREERAEAGVPACPGSVTANVTIARPRHGKASRMPRWHHTDEGALSRILAATDPLKLGESYRVTDETYSVVAIRLADLCSFQQFLETAEQMLTEVFCRDFGHVADEGSIREAGQELRARGPRLAPVRPKAKRSVWLRRPR